MYDPGYINTAAVVSKICFIDGAKGILRYRGYPIEQVRAGTSCLRSLMSGLLHASLHSDPVDRPIWHGDMYAMSSI